MTDAVPLNGAGGPDRGPTPRQAVPVVPDEQEMTREIDQDRRHERFLIRAALVAAVIIVIALAVRVIWG
ncbi:MAG TPA: hypothetical protein VII33_07775 [Nakamurella sp.]|jgi:hypothetical protein